MTPKETLKDHKQADIVQPHPGRRSDKLQVGVGADHVLPVTALGKDIGTMPGNCCVSCPKMTTIAVSDVMVKSAWKICTRATLVCFVG